MGRINRRAREKRNGPNRHEQVLLRAVRASRRDVEAAKARVETIDAALAAAQSSLRWLDSAARIVSTGEGNFRDHPLDLANHIAGAAEKRAALMETIQRLDAERIAAAGALAEAEDRAVRPRARPSGAIEPALAGLSSADENGLNQAENCVISGAE